MSANCRNAAVQSAQVAMNAIGTSVQAVSSCTSVVMGTDGAYERVNAVNCKTNK